MNTKDNINESFWRKIFTSADDVFILLGIVLNGISMIISLLEGHIIAGLILIVCEIALIITYIMKMF